MASGVSLSAYSYSHKGGSVYFDVCVRNQGPILHRSMACQAEQCQVHGPFCASRILVTTASLWEFNAQIANDRNQGSHPGPIPHLFPTHCLSRVKRFAIGVLGPAAIDDRLPP